MQVVFIVADCKLAVKKREGELYREIIWVYAIELSEVSVLEWSTAACISLAGACSDVVGHSMQTSLSLNLFHVCLIAK